MFKRILGSLSNFGKKTEPEEEPDPTALARLSQMKRRWQGSIELAKEKVTGEVPKRTLSAPEPMPTPVSPAASAPVLPSGRKYDEFSITATHRKLKELLEMGCEHFDDEGKGS